MTLLQRKHLDRRNNNVIISQKIIAILGVVIIMKKKLSAILVFSIVLTMFFQWRPLVHGEAITAPLNLGFEDGMGGWITGSGTVTAETNREILVNTGNIWKVDAKGTKMAVLVPSGSSGIFETVSSTLGLSESSKNYIKGIFPDITNAAYIYKDLDLQAGDEFEIGWNYVATDYDPYNDASFVSLVKIGNPGNTIINGVNAEVSILGATVLGTGNYSTGSYGSTGWQLANFKVLSSGTYRLGFVVYNLNDTELSPYLFVDDGRGTTLLNNNDFGYIDPDPNAPEPQVTAITVSGNSATWINQDQTITFTVNKDAGDIASVSVEGSISGNMTVTYDKGTYSFVADKNEFFTITVTDNLGGQSAVIIESKIDKAAPANIQVQYSTDYSKKFLNTLTFGMFFKDAVTVTLSADDAQSGVKEFTYTVTGQEAQTIAASEGNATFTIEPQFKGNITVSARDNAGNSTAPQAYEYLAVDNQAPTAPDIDSGTYTSGTLTTDDVVLTVSGSAALSGIVKYQYTVTSEEALSGTEIWTDISSANGTVTKTDATAIEPLNITFASITVSAPCNGYYHFRAVSNSGVNGEVETITVKIALIHAEVPVFASDLSGSKIYTKGDEAEPLNVGATVSDNGEITYQWYVNGTAIAGATGASYTPDTAKTGVYDYYVVATNTNAAVNGNQTASALSGTYRVVVNNAEVNEPDISDDAPKMTIQEDSETILDAALTAEDQSNLENGYDISVNLKVQNATDATQDEENAVFQIIGDNTLGQFIDISLIKTLVDTEGNKIEHKITQLNKPLTITIEIPEELLPKNGETKKFSIIRVHNGVATILEDLDDVPNTITFQTDCFSTYAIVYKNVSSEAPNTGYSPSVAALATVSAASLLLMITTLKRRKQVLSK